MSLSTGQVLKERYRVVRLIGQGGFGAVYRAWDTVLERPCALKENLDPRPAAERQFQREAKILARLKHPNLPDVKDYFVIPGQGQYLVMDFVQGDDLEELLARSGGKLPEEQALGWVEQVCHALEYLHTQNPPVIHRDIKPANIKITPQGQAMLVDFGIAKASESGSGTLSGAHAATPGYAPYEQYGMEPTDARSDIYSLGATLYCLLTGEPPMESIARLKGRTLVNPSQLNPKISTKTEAALLKALALHPEQRYQSAAEFRASLFPEGGGEVVRLSPTAFVTLSDEVRVRPFTEQVPLPPVQARPRPAWLLSASIGLAAAACLVGVGLLLSSLWPVISNPSLPMLVPDTASPSVADFATGILTVSPPMAATKPVESNPTVSAVDTTVLPSQQLDEQGVPIALVPAGEFMMGSEADASLAECQKFRSDCEREWFVHEEPMHAVYLEDFFIDTYEVTNALYDICVQTGRCSPPSDTTFFEDIEYSRHPVVYVDWNQARDFCQWRGGDLPSEAQWEKAARGGLDGRFYPWGNEAPVCTPGAETGAQFSACGHQTVEVGSFSPNGYGLYDMAGNVWEWVLDWYQGSFYATSPYENPSGPTSGTSRVLRGGSSYFLENYLRVANRFDIDPDLRLRFIGFRCVISP